VTADSSNARIL